MNITVFTNKLASVSHLSDLKDINGNWKNIISSTQRIVLFASSPLQSRQSVAGKKVASRGESRFAIVKFLNLIGVNALTFSQGQESRTD